MTDAAVYFGPWELDRETLVLRLDSANYEVDLEECLSSAEVLDWIMQVAQKTWATEAVITGLVRGLNEVLNPQAHLCSGGKGKFLTGAQVRKMVQRVR